MPGGILGEDVPLGPGKPEPIPNVVHLNFANSKNLSFFNLTVFQQLIESDAFFVINTRLWVNSNLPILLLSLLFP